MALVQKFSGSKFLSIFTPLLGISLVSTSAYAWWNISHLQLPISRFFAFLSTFLPILSLSAVQYLRRGNKSRNRNKRKNPPQITDKMFLATFFLLVLDTALLTLSTTKISPTALTCPLNDSWTHTWTAEKRDPPAHPTIRIIQDSLSCCGLHSPADKFYPFIHGDKVNCTTFYPERKGRSCFQPLLQQTQLSSGLFLATILGSALVKVVAFVFVRYNSNTYVQRVLYRPWFGKAEEAEVNGAGRIRDVDDEECYDSDARVRGNGVGNGVGNGDGRYIDAPAAGENDRLLGNGEESGSSGVRRANIYQDIDNDGGFGTLQPSLLR